MIDDETNKDMLILGCVYNGLYWVATHVAKELCMVDVNCDLVAAHILIYLLIDA